MNRTTKNRTDEADPKIADAAESENALRRWSRRKHEARSAARREPEKADPMPAANVETRDPAPARVLTDVDMPPIDSLDEHSDYSPFMSPGVSEALRRAALRRLFRAPQFNVLCELEGEFFDARGYQSLGNIVTYEMRDALERELAKAKSSAEEKIRAEFITPEQQVSATEGHPVTEAQPAAGALPEANVAATTRRGSARTKRGDA
jgi:Protein of unknown function (DUF3306)